jgi:CRISPR-associated protein Cas2
METDEDIYHATPQTRGRVAHTSIDNKVASTKLRTKFSKMLQKQGAIRVQNSVYEVENTKRIVDNIKMQIEVFRKQFCLDDSVIIFDVVKDKLIKYGNAIHRDEPIVYF